LVACSLILGASIQSASAQQPVNAQANVSGTVAVGDGLASRPEPDNLYRIGPGDVLAITILDRPELSGEARVDGRGMIPMPMIPGGLQVSCRTEAEVAKQVATGYAKYLKDPEVKVYVREYQSQPVAAIGAVTTPGRFQLQRRVRLLQLLAFANGPAPGAGRSVQIIHDPTAPTCEAETANDIDALVSYNLSDTMRGVEQANPYVRPGDIITILTAEQVFILGNVRSPAAIPLKESLTLSQAIAMVGGILPDTKRERVRIVRQAPGGAKTEIFVDLKAIDKLQAPDIVLQANDIVDVPGNSGVGHSLKGMLRTVIPTLARFPLIPIP
jgi:polysaccharide export outer membrane protein